MSGIQLASLLISQCGCRLQKYRLLQVTLDIVLFDRATDDEASLQRPSQCRFLAFLSEVNITAVVINSLVIVATAFKAVTLLAVFGEVQGHQRKWLTADEAENKVEETDSR